MVEIIDPLNDYLRMQSQSENCSFDSSNTSFFMEDASWLARTTRTSASITYLVTAGLKRFVVWGWFWPRAPLPDCSFSRSLHDVTYTAWTPAKATMDEGAFNWHKVLYQGVWPPVGTKFLKISFPTASAHPWNLQIGAVLLFD
jgi:hypothetical protein